MVRIKIITEHPLHICSGVANESSKYGTAKAMHLHRCY